MSMRPNTNTNSPTDIFRARLFALLDGPGRQFHRRLGTIDNPRVQQLVQTIEDFRGFAQSYFDFFLDPSSGSTEVSELSAALQILQQEMEVLSRAGQQRLVDDFAHALGDVDELAATLYDRFSGYKEDKAALPIIYFEKVFGIRRGLYTSFPLISVPLLTLSEPDQWPGGVAHELGHYIYWNSSTLETFSSARDKLDEAVLEALQIPHSSFASFHEAAEVAAVWHDWLEETFADICGTLLIGPRYVLSAIRLAEESRGALTSDDGEHPAPYIRPLIGIATIDWLARQERYAPARDQLVAAADHLRRLWLPRVKTLTDQKHEDRPIKMGEVDAKTTVVVETILGAGSNSWFDAEGKATPLGDLFDCAGWLSELPADGQLPPSAVPALPDDSKYSDSPAFEKLRQFLEQENGSPEAMRQALLLRDLSGSQGNVCHQRWVKRVADGKGNYEKC